MRRTYIGVDEVGRGAWAGPLVLAALFFKKDIKIPDCIFIRDSKTLSRAQRASSEVFLRKSSTFVIQGVPRGTIDNIGIQGATVLGIEALCQKFKAKIIKITGVSKSAFDRQYQFLIDGRRICRPAVPHEFIIGGDDKISVISGASIIAKTYRDRLMCRASITYPGYGFENHVGYGTREHQEALKKYGICDIHRRSYAPIKLYTLSWTGKTGQVY